MIARVARFVAVMLLVALPIAQVARGAMLVEVHCCCGDHAADEDCGCPECPAGGHRDGDGDGDRDRDRAPETTSFRACSAGGEMFEVGGFPPFILSAPPMIATAQRAPRATPPPDAMPPDPLIERPIVPI